MTDNFEKDINVPSKEIIIDGVDVSGCESFCRGICCQEGFGASASCKLFSDCLYKQLKRKEQECEELKKSVEHWQMEHKEAKAKGEWTYALATKRLGQQLDQLKAELEQEQALKETYLACYKAKHEDIESELFKLRQTLQDVREMASKFDYWNNNLSQASRVLNEIVDRINEVIENE